MGLPLDVGAFVVGVAIVIFATNRLLEGLVGIARAECAEEHLPGALNIPLKELTAETPGSSTTHAR
jgi:hypothetical protein